MVAINRLGDAGFLYDEKPYTLPLQAWSDLKNVRFFDGSAYTTYGHTAVLGVPNIRAYFLKGTLDISDVPIFAYAGLAKVYSTDGTAHTDITRVSGGDYTATEADRWNGFNFGNITVLNNGVDLPQAWVNPATGTPLVNLANWPSTARCKVMRGFRRYLVALDVTKSSTRYKSLVKWSHVADIPGAVPSSWDETNENLDAGEYALIDTEGAVIDCLPISNDINLIYKSDAVHAMRWVGGQYIFDLPLLHQSWGLLAQGCVGMWNRRHVALSPDNLFLYDGNSYESVMKRRILRWWQNRIDTNNSFRTFLVINHAEAEAWICFPETGATWPNLALIISLEGGMSTVVDLPKLSHIDYNQVLTGSGETFDDFEIPIDNMVGFFDQSSTNVKKKRMIGVTPYKIRNILRRSEELGDALWTTVNATVSNNVLGTYDKIIPSVANGVHYIKYTTGVKNASEIGTFTAVCEATAGGYSGFRLWPYSVESSQSAWAQFDLANGTVVSTGFEGSFAVLSSGIEAISPGVYRCWVTFRTDADPNLNMALYVLQTGAGATTFAGNGTDGVTLGKVMIREGTSRLPYQKTVAAAQNSAFFLLDAGFTFDGENYSSFVERQGLSITGQNRDGTPRSDPKMKVLLTGLWPKIELLSGADIQISIGGQESPEGAITWQLRNFVPTELVAYFDIETRYIAVRYESSNGQFWRLTEHDFDVAPIGQF